MALLLVPAQQADAQGFLKKALNKAKELTKSTQTVEEEEEEEDDSSSRSTSRSSRSNSDDDGGLGVASAKEQLQPKRQSTLTWDEAVVPSTASSADALMKELPAVPSVAQLIEPDEDTQILYYRAIKKVSLRAEQLNEEATCDDETTNLWRNKANLVLKDLGLTDADIAALENENLPDAERERISQKVEAFFSAGSTSKHAGAPISSRLIPPNVGSIGFTASIIFAGSVFPSSLNTTPRHSGTASMSANFLNRTALPSMTGSPAPGPILPSPRTAVPSLTTATELPRPVYFQILSGSALISRHGAATPGV